MTLELRNNKNQTLTQLEIRPTVDQVLGKFYFDGLGQEELDQN